MVKTTKILVVDNDPDFVKLVRNTLGDSAYQVIIASDRKSGLEKARRESVDMVIVGALEPRGDAFKLYKELRGSPKTATIPMLVVDVRPDEHSRKGWRVNEGMQMNAEDYISRPIESDELVESVERVLERATRRTPIDFSKILEETREILNRVEKLAASLGK